MTGENYLRFRESKNFAKPKFFCPSLVRQLESKLSIALGTLLTQVHLDFLKHWNAKKISALTRSVIAKSQYLTFNIPKRIVTVMGELSKESLQIVAEAEAQIERGEVCKDCAIGGPVHYTEGSSMDLDWSSGAGRRRLIPHRSPCRGCPRVAIGWIEILNDDDLQEAPLNRG